MSEEQKQKTQQKTQQETPKFPSEVIDLPSEGKIYPEDSPLRDGKVEIKYMTAREEDILTSQNLIKKGIVIDRLLDSLILTPGITEFPFRITPSISNITASEEYDLKKLLLPVNMNNTMKNFNCI